MFNPLYNIFTLTAILAGIETVAMTALTAYSKNVSQTYYLILGVLIYAIGRPFFILKSLDFEGIGTVNFMWNLITAISMIVIGHYYFGDNMNHLHLWSLILGLGAMVLLYFADKQ